MLKLWLEVEEGRAFAVHGGPLNVTCGNPENRANRKVKSQKLNLKAKGEVGKAKEGLT